MKKITIVGDIYCPSSSKVLLSRSLLGNRSGVFPHGWRPQLSGEEKLVKLSELGRLIGRWEKAVIRGKASPRQVGAIENLYSLARHLMWRDIELCDPDYPFVMSPAYFIAERVEAMASRGQLVVPRGEQVELDVL